MAGINARGRANASARAGVVLATVLLVMTLASWPAAALSRSDAVHWNRVAPTAVHWNGVAPTAVHWNGVAPTAVHWNGVMR